ncbi:hypothetical protein HanIR_Chr02g0084191 [Helianthus annuus]|nr:hypothetical protein HanIR_Chr02g0084191 [Helianthus annuus]
MSSWVYRPLLLHKTLAPLHPFSSTHHPPPPLPPPPLHLRRPTPADTHLQSTPNIASLSTSALFENTSKKNPILLLLHSRLLILLLRHRTSPSLKLDSIRSHFLSFC